MSTQASQADPLPPETVEALRSWTLTKEAARRCDRNLLQFAASFAAALGVEASSAGVIAVASGLGTGIPDWLKWLMLGIMGITGLIAIGMSLLLARAYTERQKAEKEADFALSRLIELSPHEFLPQKGLGP